jgi:ABC-2 type transport system ATP-binding protein
VASRGRVIARGSSAELLDALPGEVRVTGGGEDVRVATTNSTATLLEVLRDRQQPVESVELRNPTLDDLYSSLAASHD